MPVTHNFVVYQKDCPKKGQTTYAVNEKPSKASRDLERLPNTNSQLFVTAKVLKTTLNSIPVAKSTTDFDTWLATNLYVAPTQARTSAATKHQRSQALPITDTPPAPDVKVLVVVYLGDNKNVLYSIADTREEAEEALRAHDDFYAGTMEEYTVQGSLDPQVRKTSFDSFVDWLGRNERKPAVPTTAGIN